MIRRAKNSPRSGRPSDYARRDFLRNGGLLGLGVGLAGLAGCGEEAQTFDGPPAPPRTPTPVELGRTGVRIPDIGFGTFTLDGNEELVRFAFDQGITHFDTAEDYQHGRAEETLGRALQGLRDRATITTKMVAAADAPVGQLMQRLEASLTRLRTDHVDFMLNHAVDSPARMANPGWSEFVQRAKEQGKIRFAGMSGHGPSLVPCLDAALDADQLDVILVAYNYIQSPDFLDAAKVFVQRQLGKLDWVALQPELPDFLTRAKQKGVGVMTMKTLRGARKNDMRPYEGTGATFAQAALRWVLSDPRVDAAMITMNDRASVEEYLGASGGIEPTGEDMALLTRYESMQREQQCVQGCGACADACPAGVPISEVLRAGMYDRDYGQSRIAREVYAGLAADGQICLACSGEPCATACPTGLSIPRQARDAHRRLARVG